MACGGGARNACPCTLHYTPDERLKTIAPRQSRVQVLTQHDDVPKEVEFRREVVQHAAVLQSTRSQPMVVEQERIDVHGISGVLIGRECPTS